MSAAPLPPGGWRGALRGAEEGALYVGLGSFAGMLLSRHSLGEAGLAALVAAGFGAIMFAIGRSVAGRLWGAIPGALIAMVAGAYIGQSLIGQLTYHVPAAAQNGREIEIAGPTLDSKEFDLQSLRGKVVLVDFWATWCGPCVAELPNVLKVYERYHQDGFEVVGVSLDESRERLQEFVERKRVPWTQVFFTEEGQQGWKNPLARRYEVDAIPATFLIDRDGKVAAEDVRGPDLAPAVARLLDKESGQVTGAAPAAPRLKIASFPAGLVIGSLLGCVAGALGGALLERSLRQGTSRLNPPRPPNGPPLSQ